MKIIKLIPYHKNSGTNMIKPEKFNEIKSLNWIEIKDEEFQLLRNLVYDRIGINLTEDKKNLLMGRLQKLLRKYNLVNFRDYYNFVRTDKTGEALSELANSISTNHTFFYRENDHFEFFAKKILPELSKKMQEERTNDLRIWSAGCSSGEEPYTLIMLMLEYFGPAYGGLSAGILATDISENALNTARRAVYPNERIKYLPDSFKKKYFKKIGDDEFEVVEAVRKEVTYRRFNLMNKQFPFKKQFDIIFCRNVMIYFDNETREHLVDRFYQHTAPGGWFFIGHSESLNRETTKYKYIMPALYRKL